MSSSKRREMKSLDSLLDKTFENKPVSLKVNKLSKNILISCNLRGNYGSEVVRVLAVCWQLGIALQSAEVKLGVKSNGKCSLQPLSVFLCCIHVFFVDLFVCFSHFSHFWWTQLLIPSLFRPIFQPISIRSTRNVIRIEKHGFLEDSTGVRFC